MTWHDGRVSGTDNVADRSPVVRYRLHRSRGVAGLIVTISMFTLVAVSPWFAPLVLPPLAWTIWVWRAGTDVDPDGLRVRALLASRRLPWSQVTALAPGQRGQVVAQLTSGGYLPLTAVTVSDLPQLAGLATGRD